MGGLILKQWLVVQFDVEIIYRKTCLNRHLLIVDMWFLINHVILLELIKNYNHGYNHG